MIHPLAREVAIWLGVKVVALCALFLLFFSPEHRPTVTPDTVEQLLLSPGPAPSPEDPVPHD